MKQPTQLQKQRHIWELCGEHNILVMPSPEPDNSMSNPLLRVIAIHPIKDDASYAVALHEIGHILGQQSYFTLEREAFAWLWAKANALEWTLAMEEDMHRSLGTYADGFAEDFPNGKPEYDSEVFRSLYKPTKK